MGAACLPGWFFGAVQGAEFVQNNSFKRLLCNGQSHKRLKTGLAVAGEVWRNGMPWAEQNGFFAGLTN